MATKALSGTLCPMSFTVRTLRDTPPRTRRWAARAVAVLSVAQPLLTLFQLWKRHHDRDRKKQMRISILKRTLIVLVAVFFALALLAGIGRAMVSVRNIGFSNVLSVAGADLPTDANGMTNLLLLGQGDSDHDGKNLTDTIIIASIDPATRSVAMLSLPRDLYLLSTEKMGKGKLNTMYRDFRSYLIFQKGIDAEEADTEALQELSAEIGRNLGIEIHHTVKVDFTAFIRAVDLLGGIDVDVPYDINDQEYPDEQYGFEPLVLHAGMQHMDGETALKYARSRHTTSDFGRSARQQQILGIMAEKAKKEGVLKDAGAITSFMKIMNENVDTTMSLRELIGAADLAQDIDRSNIITMQLNDRNALYDYIIEPGGMLYTPPRDLFDGASVLLPVSIPEYPVTWKQPQALAELLFRNRGIYLEKPSVAILNAGAAPGSARKLATELIRFGFDVPVVENGETKKQDTSIIVSTPEPDPAVSFFSILLDLPTLTAPADLPVAQKQRVTIILGKDYTYKPVQNLIDHLSPATNPQPPTPLS